MAKKHYEKVAEHLKSQAEGEEPKPAQDDLDSREVQDEIMNPNGTPIDLSFGKFTVFPLTLEYEARAYGLCSAIMADSYGAGARSLMEIGFRISAVILRRSDYKRELLTLAGIASGRPGTMDEQKAEVIAKDLLGKCKGKDYVDLFHAIFRLSGLKEVPKPMGA